MSVNTSVCLKTKENRTKEPPDILRENYSVHVVAQTYSSWFLSKYFYSLSDSANLWTEWLMLQMLFGNLKPCYARNDDWKRIQLKLYWTKSVECIVKCKKKTKNKQKNQPGKNPQTSAKNPNTPSINKAYRHKIILVFCFLEASLIYLCLFCFSSLWLDIHSSRWWKCSSAV